MIQLLERFSRILSLIACAIVLSAPCTAAGASNTGLDSARPSATKKSSFTRFHVKEKNSTSSSEKSDSKIPPADDLSDSLIWKPSKSSLLNSPGSASGTKPGLKQVNVQSPKTDRQSVEKDQSAKQAQSAKTRQSAKEAHRKNKNPSVFVRGHYVLGPYLPVAHYASKAPTVVVVDKGSHFTHVLQYQHGKVVRVYTMSNAVGKGSTPSPPGRYTVTHKKIHPTWIPPKSIDPKQKPVPPYNQTHKNPLGEAAIFLNKFGVLLHGTNTPEAIRNSVSHGCVRHSNADISRLYGMVRPGTVVYIVNRFRGKVLNARDFGVKS